MPWTRLDDDFFAHPKIVAAGDSGVALYVRGLSYCSRYLTDGFIAACQIRSLTEAPDPIVVAERLVTVGLWERVEDGYQVHDYLDYNPSREEVKKHQEHVSQERSKAGSIGAQRRWQTDGNGIANGIANEWQNDGPEPEPVPDIDLQEYLDDGANAPAAIPKPAISSAEKTPKRKRQPKSPKSAAAAYLEGVGKIRLRDIQCAMIDEVITRSPPDLQRWKDTVNAWLSDSKRNPGNVTGMLDWYKQGIPDYAKPGYKPTRRDNGSTTAQRDRGASDLTPEEEQAKRDELKRIGFKRAGLVFS